MAFLNCCLVCSELLWCKDLWLWPFKEAQGSWFTFLYGIYDSDLYRSTMVLICVFVWVYESDLYRSTMALIYVLYGVYDSYLHRSTIVLICVLYGVYDSDLYRSTMVLIYVFCMGSMTLTFIEAPWSWFSFLYGLYDSDLYRSIMVLINVFAWDLWLWPL